MSKQLIFPFDSDQYPKINNFFYRSNNEVLIKIIKDSIFANNNENFFIYGERDSGKSFLLQAICNEYSANGRKSIYIPMAKAINMQANMLENLNELDAVCIDDFTKFYHSTDYKRKRGVNGRFPGSEIIEDFHYDNIDQMEWMRHNTWLRAVTFAYKKICKF